jgi:hypothetical protein
VRQRIFSAGIAKDFLPVSPLGLDHRGVLTETGDKAEAQLSTNRATHGARRDQLRLCVLRRELLAGASMLGIV